MELTRETETRGTDVLLTLRDGQNAVQVIMYHRGNGEWTGVMGFHYAQQQHSAGDPGPCDVLPGGTCFPDVTYIGGQDVARLWAQGDVELAWQKIEDWAEGRIGVAP